MSAARDAALAANAMQKNFAASASHELRTPTTSILGYTEEILESDDLSERDRGFLDIVYRNAQRLTQLIDDLLILDRAEIGPSMMHFEDDCRGAPRRGCRCRTFRRSPAGRHRAHAKCEGDASPRWSIPCGSSRRSTIS